MRHLRFLIFWMILSPGLALGGPFQQIARQPGLIAGSVGLELNKIEQDGQSCRLYLLTDNQSGLAFSTFTLEMVLFDKAGIIDRNMGLDIAPLPRAKKMVTAFNVKDIQCGAIGSILINQIMQCEAATSKAPDCMSLLDLSTRTDIAVNK